MNPKILVDGEFILEKFPQKGGWTYVLFPELEKPKAYFGMLKVSGKIDSYDLGQVTLMPFGNGKLFLPVNAKIRKAIQKEEGDSVKLKLTLLKEKVEKVNFSEETIFDCIKEEPLAWKNFQELSEDQQQQELQDILQLHMETKKIERIVRLIEKLRYL